MKHKKKKHQPCDILFIAKIIIIITIIIVEFRIIYFNCNYLKFQLFCPHRVWSQFAIFAPISKFTQSINKTNKQIVIHFSNNNRIFSDISAWSSVSCPKINSMSNAHKHDFACVLVCWYRLCIGAMNVVWGAFIWICFCFPPWVI